jgi:hypothetical protein
LLRDDHLDAGIGGFLLQGFGDLSANAVVAALWIAADHPILPA